MALIEALAAKMQQSAQSKDEKFQHLFYERIRHGKKL